MTTTDTPLTTCTCGRHSRPTQTEQSLCTNQKGPRAAKSTFCGFAVCSNALNAFGDVVSDSQETQWELIQVKIKYMVQWPSG